MKVSVFYFLIYVVIVMASSFLLTIIPSIASNGLDDEDLFYPMSLPALKVDETLTYWKKEFKVKIPFKIPSGRLDGFNVTISVCEYYLDVDLGESSMITIEYTLTCNDERIIPSKLGYNWSIRHDIISRRELKFHGGTKYEEKIIPTSALRTGENMVEILISIRYESDKPIHHRFHYMLSKTYGEKPGTYVRVKVLDRDGDGVPDPLDLAVGIHNLTLTVSIALLASILPIKAFTNSKKRNAIAPSHFLT